MVAEDEAIIRLDLIEALRGEGYDVVGDCASGDRAVEMAVELQPDIVLLDIKMPNLDGITAARRIMDKTEAAVVMLTAFAQRDLIGEASEAGAMAYLVKPYRRIDLVPTLELALARRSEAVMLAAKLDDLKGKFEERRVVDRAKGRLMDGYGLSEADSYRLLQHSAMATRRRMVDVAEAVVRGDPAAIAGLSDISIGGDTCRT